MKFVKNLKIWLALTAFLVTVGVLCGGQIIAAKLKVNDPLLKEIGTVKAIRNFTVKPMEQGLVIDLTLLKTPDLQATLDFVKDKTEFYHKKKVVAFNIIDHSDQRLRKLRYELSFYIEEALASGEYVKLKAELDSLAAPGVVSRVYLSKDFLYLQLEAGHDYLYRAIPRGQAKTATDGGIGGETG